MEKMPIAAKIPCYRRFIGASVHHTTRRAIVTYVRRDHAPLKQQTRMCFIGAQ